MKHTLLILLLSATIFACDNNSLEEKKPTGYYKVKNNTTLSFISFKNPKYNNDIKVIVERNNQRE